MSRLKLENNPNYSIDAELPALSYFDGGVDSIIAERKPLFRGVMCSFETIFPKGFKARGSNLDILNHVYGPRLENINSIKGFYDSAYVSTSSSKYQASRFPFFKNLSDSTRYTYLYEIHSTRPTINISHYLPINFKGNEIEYEAYRIFSDEKEFAFTSKIYPHEIKGGWRLKFDHDLNNRVLDSPFIPNSHYKQPVLPSDVNKLLNTSRMIGRGLTGIGIALDMHSIYGEYEISKKLGDFDNTYREGSSIAGGWLGAWLGGSTLAELGAIGCLPLSPIASAVCGVAGGLVGALTGYKAGSEVGVKLYDVTRSKSCPITLGIFASAAHASDLNEQNNEMLNMRLTQVVPDHKDKALNETSPVTVPQQTSQINIKSPSTFSSAEQAQEAVNNLNLSLSMLAKVWAQDACDMTGFEREPAIIKLAEELRLMQSNKAPDRSIMEQVGKIKDAKFAITAERREFDYHLQGIEGLKDMACAGALLAHKPQLAAKANALFSIGKHFSALSGFGGAAIMHPALAAGGIALGVVSLIASFKDKDEKEAAKAEQEFKRALFEMLTCIRKELHERFDTTDAKIESLHADLTYYFMQNNLKQEQTLLVIKQQAEQNNKAHETTHHHLVSVQNKIDDLFTQVRNQHTIQEIRGITDPVRCSLNYIDIKPTPEQYKAWLSQFQLFIEQTTYAAPLTGGPHLPIAVSGKLSAEALFAINTVANYLDESLGRQPHHLLFVYSSLAILRLIYLLNASETKKIRRNEFDILLLIDRKCSDIEKFIENLQAEKYATQLVDEYVNAAKHISTLLPQTLEEIIQDKTRHLNDALSLQLKMQWNEQAHQLASQVIDARIDYTQWFQGWTVAHYGTTEYYDNIVTSNPRINYQARRKQQLENHKQIISQPALISNPTLKLLITAQGMALEIGSLSAHPTLALMPENTADPVLSLRQQNGQLIDLDKFFDIPKVCYEAVFLGIGSLHYRYRVDNNSLRISAVLETGGKTHEIRSATCTFTTGNYNRREGILWGWLGESVVNLQQAGPSRWIGSTGKDKHWFLSYGMLPVISPSIPIPQLFNQPGHLSPSFNKTFTTAHLANIGFVRDAVKVKLAELLKEFEAALKLKYNTPDTAMAQGLNNLEASKERLQAYAMLTLPDDCDNNKALDALRTLSARSTIMNAFTLQNKTLMTKELLSKRAFWMDSAGYNARQYYDTLRSTIIHIKGVPHLVTAIRDCLQYELQLQNLNSKELYRTLGTQWTSKGGFDQPQYYETIRLNVIDIAGTQHVAAMCRNNSCYEIHFYNPETKTWHYEAGPAWTDKAGYDNPEFYKTIRTEVVTIKGIQHLVLMIRNISFYELHVFNPVAKTWRQIPNIKWVAWTSASGYNQPQFYECIRTAVASVDGTELLLLMSRNVSAYSITTYNFTTDAWGSLPAPIWSDAKAYNKPEYYKTIRAEVMNVAGIAYAALLIRSQTHLELHLINTKTGALSAYEGPAWSDAQGFYKPEYYETIRTAVLERNGVSYLGVMIRNATEYAMNVFDVSTKRWIVLPNWPAAASHVDPAYHQTLRLQAMPEGCDADFVATVREANGIVFNYYSLTTRPQLSNNHFLLQENNDQYLLQAIQDQKIVPQSGALTVANDLSTHLLTLNETVKQPLLKLLRANRGVSSNNLLATVFAHIRDAKLFYENRIDETGKYEDVFAESEATKKRFEEVSLLLNVVVGAVAEENDPALRARLLERVQKNLSQKSLSGLKVFGLLAGNFAEKSKVQEILPENVNLKNI